VKESEDRNGQRDDVDRVLIHEKAILLERRNQKNTYDIIVWKKEPNRIRIDV